MILTNTEPRTRIAGVIPAGCRLAILMFDLVLEENQRGLLHWFSVATWLAASGS